MTVVVRAVLSREELRRRQGVGAGEANGERGVPAPGRLSCSRDSSLCALRTWFMQPASRQLQAGGRRASCAGWEGSAEGWWRWARLGDCGVRHSAPWTAIPRTAPAPKTFQHRGQWSGRSATSTCGRGAWSGLEAKLPLWDPDFTETPIVADIVS